jgi:integrase
MTSQLGRSSERMTSSPQVSINWGARDARKTFKLVRSHVPGDLVFHPSSNAAQFGSQCPARHIKPTARKLGIGWLNWQVLRHSYATQLVEAGADPKAVQAQMGQSRSSNHLDIYARCMRCNRPASSSSPPCRHQRRSNRGGNPCHTNPRERRQCASSRDRLPT